VITAVDTNVLIDVLRADPNFGMWSALALGRCVGEGEVIACDAVVGELAHLYRDPAVAARELQLLGVVHRAGGMAAALEAARIQRHYREQGGGRERLLTDFLVAAHAQTMADRLLTRDHGFYRAYFPRLQILDPTRLERRLVSGREPLTPRRGR
jgi:predicted nucleic acid-binding protein